MNENARSRRCTSGKIVLSVSLFFNSKVTLYCSEMAQQFANDDLFDAELGEDSDGGQHGDCSEDENASKSPAPDWIDNENQDNSNEEAANSGSDEDTMPKKKNKQRKRESRKKVGCVRGQSILLLLVEIKLRSINLCKLDLNFDILITYLAIDDLH